LGKTAIRSVAKGNTMTVPQFLPHSDFDSSFESDFDLLLDLDEIKPEQKFREKSNKSKAPVKKVMDMSSEEIREELKTHRERIASLEANEVQSKDFDTRFNANIEIQKLAPRMKRLSEQQISLLKHQIACLKNGGL
jgi:hypothetical protein